MALALSSSLSLTSCMDLDPKDSLGDNLVWEKPDNYKLFANQFYAWTRDLAGSNYQSTLNEDGSTTNSGSVHSDYRSDLVCRSTVNTYSQGTNPVTASDGNFTTLYKRIYYTNLLLKNAEGRNDVNTPKGEALWFRAYLHFELVQIYGDCQLLTEPLDISAGELYGSRNDRGVVIDQIIADLKQAADLLPDVPAETGRLCKDAANALLSRVALYEGTWQKFHNNNTTRANSLLTIAKEAANAVISGGHYKIFHNDGLVNVAANTIGAKDQSYRYMFILEDAAQCNPAGLDKNANTEYILSHRHRDGDKLSLNLTHAFAGNACFVTAKMADMYLCSDGLPVDKSPLYKNTALDDEFKNRDARMDNSLLYNGERFWDNDTKDGSRLKWNDDDALDGHCRVAGTKQNSGYLTQKWAVERAVSDNYESIDYPVIRYAEVLLNYAEALFELNGSITDADLDRSLNLVRLRVNPTMPKLSNAFASANGLDMRTEIRRERTVELFLEGFRIDDLKRWKTAETEMPADLLGVKVTGTAYEGWNHGKSLSSDGRIILYGSRTWTQKHYLHPLPSDQRQLNTNLSQNPGWE